MDSVLQTVHKHFFLNYHGLMYSFINNNNNVFILLKQCKKAKYTYKHNTYIPWYVVTVFQPLLLPCVELVFPFLHKEVNTQGPECSAAAVVPRNHTKLKIGDR